MLNRWFLVIALCFSAFNFPALGQCPTGAGSDLIVCDQFGSNIETILAANAPGSGNTGLWTIVAPLGGGGGFFDDATDPNTRFTGAPGSEFILRWTVTLGGGGDCSDDVIVYFVSNPTTANAGADQIGADGVCGTGAAATLAATPTAAGTGTWTQTAGPGTAVFADANSPTSTVTVDTEGTYTFTWSTSNSPCLDSTDTVDVEFFDDITVSNAGPDQTGAANICGPTTAANLAANAIGAGETGTWTQSSQPPGGIAAFVDPNDPNTTVTANVVGTYSFTWTISAGVGQSCVDSVDVMQVEWVDNPTISAAGPDQTGVDGVCGEGAGNTATLAANTPTVGTGAWTQTFGPDVAVFSDASSPTSTVHVPTGFAGSYTFRWTISNSKCADSIDDVDVDFFRDITAAAAGADQNVCGTTTFLGGNVATVGEAGLWTVVTGDGGGALVDATNPGTQFTGNLDQTYTLRWTLSEASGPCLSTSDDVVIEFFEGVVANAGEDQEICGNPTQIVERRIGQSLPIPDNGDMVSDTITIADPGTGSFPSSAVISDLNVYVAIDGDVVDGLLDGIRIDLVHESGAAATLIESSCAGLEGDYYSLYDDEANRSACEFLGYALFNDPVLPETSLSVFDGLSVTGEWELQVRDLNNNNISGLLGSWHLRLTIESEVSVSLNAEAPGTGIGRWSIVTGEGGSFADAMDPTTTFTGKNGEEYTLRWSVTELAPCVDAQDDLVIRFRPNVSSDIPWEVLCEGENTATLEAPDPAIYGGEGIWTITYGSDGGGFFDGMPGTTTSTNPNATFNGNLGQSYSVNWEHQNSVCGNQSYPSSVLFRSPPKIQANAGLDQVVCVEGEDVPFAMLSPKTAGEFNTWDLISATPISEEYTAGGEVLEGALYPNASFWGNLGVRYVFQLSIYANYQCEPSSVDQVEVLFIQIDEADAGDDQVLCEDTATLEANTPLYGTGRWEVVPGLGGSFTDPNRPDTSFTGIPGTQYELRWVISNEYCRTDDTVLITFRDQPNATAGDQKVCADQVTLDGGHNEGPLPDLMTGEWTIETGDGHGEIQDPSNPNSLFSGTLGETYVLSWTISNPFCAPSSIDVVIQFETLGTTPETGPDVTLCTGVKSILELDAAPIPDDGNTTFSTTIALDIAGQVNDLSVILDLTHPNSSELSVQIQHGDTIETLKGVDVCNIATDRTLVFDQTAPISWSCDGENGRRVAAVGDTDPFRFYSPVLGDLDQFIGHDIAGEWTLIITDHSSGNQGVVNNWGLLLNKGQVQLAGNEPSEGTAEWRFAADGNTDGLGYFEQPGQHTSNNPNALFVGASNTEYEIEWSIAGSACSQEAGQMIMFGTAPSVAHAGVDQQICGDSVVLNAHTPAVGTGFWQEVEGDGLGQFTAENDPQTVFRGTPGQVYLLSWTVSNNVCLVTENNDQVRIELDLLPTSADAGSDQDLCAVTETTLAGNPPEVGTGLWSIKTGTGGYFDGDPTKQTSDLPNASFHGQIGESYLLCWTITNQSCDPSIDDVRITFSAGEFAIINPQPEGVCHGASVSLIMTGACEQGLTFQWRHQGDNLPGATAPILTIDNFTELDAGEYTCVVTNSNFETNVGPVMLSHIPPPTVADAGMDQSLCAIDTVTLSGNTPDVGEGTWHIINGDGMGYFDGVQGKFTSNVPGASFSGSVGQSYRLGWTIANGACLPSGTSEVTVSFIAAEFHIDGAPHGPICPGSSLTLNLDGACDAGLTYQWRFGGSEIPGATSANLVFDGFTRAEAGFYDCLVTIGVDVVHHSARIELTSHDAPQVSGPTVPMSVDAGETLELLVTVNPEVTVKQWQKERIDLVGMNGTTLTLADITEKDAGFYRCRITSSCDEEVFSNEVEVVVNPPAPDPSPPDTIIISAVGSEVVIGEQLTFEAKAVNTDEPSFEWRIEKEGGGLQFAREGSVLQLDSNQLAGPGQYLVTCTAVNAVGVRDPSPAQVRFTVVEVLTPVVRIVAPATQGSFQISLSEEQVTLQAEASDLPEDAVLQWTRLGDRHVILGTGLTFTYPLTQEETVTLILAVVSNGEELTSDSLTLTVTAPDEVPLELDIISPVSNGTFLTVPVNQPLQLQGSLTGTGSEAFEVEWFNGEDPNPISGRSAQTSYDEPGNYQLRLVARSATRTLQVTRSLYAVDPNNPPVVDINFPTDQAVQPGDFVFFDALVIDDRGYPELNYFWDFGLDVNGNRVTSSQRTPGRIFFPEAGEISVSLYAVGDTIPSDTTSRRIFVEENQALPSEVPEEAPTFLPGKRSYSTEGPASPQYFKIVVPDGGKRVEIFVEFGGTAIPQRRLSGRILDNNFKELHKVKFAVKGDFENLDEAQTDEAKFPIPDNPFRVELGLANKSKSSDYGENQPNQAKAAEPRVGSLGLFDLDPGEYFVQLLDVDDLGIEDLSLEIKVAVLNPALYFSDVRYDAEFSSQIGMINPSPDEWASVELTGYDSIGNTVDAAHFRLPPSGRMQRDLSGWFGNDPSCIVFVRADSSVRLTGHMLTQSRDLKELYAVNAVDQLSSELLAPHLGDDTATWSSRATLANGLHRPVEIADRPDDEVRESISAFSQLDVAITDPPQPWLRLVDYHKNLSLAGTVVFGKKDGTRSTAGLEMVDVRRADRQAVYGKYLIFPHVAGDTDHFWTGVALSNLDNKSRKLLVQAFDSEGKPLGEAPLQLDLEAGGKVVATVPELLGDTDPSREAAWVGVASENGVDLVFGALLFGSTSGQSLAGLEATYARYRELHFPFFDDTDELRNGFAVVNPRGQSNSLTFLLYDNRGVLLRDPVVREISANQRLLFTPDSLFPDLGPDESAGWIRCRAAEPVTGFLLMVTANGERMGAVLGR